MIGNSNTSEVIEILKQKILALKTKIERFANRCKFFKDNKKFETNQRRFYQDLDKEKQESSHQIPDKKKTLEFRSKIWERNKGHKKEAKLILELEEINKSVPKQNKYNHYNRKDSKSLKKDEELESCWTRQYSRILDQELNKHLRKTCKSPSNCFRWKQT